MVMYPVSLTQGIEAILFIGGLAQYMPKISAPSKALGQKFSKGLCVIVQSKVENSLVYLCMLITGRSFQILPHTRQ